jgi:hypothetical protein
MGFFSPTDQAALSPGWWMTAVWWNLQLGTWTTPPRSSEVRPLLSLPVALLGREVLDLGLILADSVQA